MYSSIVCPVEQPVRSNTVGVTVHPVLNAAVSLTASPELPRPGSPVVFTAHAVNGGPTPVYTWLVNGLAVANGRGNSWSASSLHNGDRVTVQMTSSVPCPSSPVAPGNEIVIGRNPTAVPGFEAADAVDIYPNPVSATLRVDLRQAHAGPELVIYDDLGRALIRKPLQGAMNTIDLSELPATCTSIRCAAAGSCATASSSGTSADISSCQFCGIDNSKYQQGFTNASRKSEYPGEPCRRNSRFVAAFLHLVVAGLDRSRNLRSLQAYELDCFCQNRRFD